MKLLLIDGNSLLHRAFYALPLLTTASGEHTNAVYGFLTMFYSVLEKENPTHIAVAFDRREPTFRHQQYAEYKAGRRPMPVELVPQVPLLKETLTALRIPVVELAGFEADDLIGTLTRAHEKQGEVLILTGDKDELQLISPHTTVLITKKGISETERYTPQYLKDKLELEPWQIIDLKALMGDASDNIPGIQGVGEKTALKLLYSYKTVEAVLANAQAVGGKLGEKLAAGKEAALFSKELATICTNAPTEILLEQLHYAPPPPEEISALFTRLEFKTLLSRLKITGSEAPTVAEEPVESIMVYNPAEIQLGELVAFTHRTSPEAFCFCSQAKTEYVLPIQASLLDEGLPFAQALEAARQLLAGKKILAANGKELYHLFGPNILLHFDVSLARYLLEPGEAGYTLAHLEKAYKLNTREAALVYRLYELQAPRLAELNLEKLFREVELPLVKLLYQMELCGFGVDKRVLHGLSQELEAQIASLTKELHQLAGTAINLNSPKQLGQWLFEELKLPRGRKTKTGWSTDVDALEEIKNLHPAVPLLLSYRTAAKFKSTYVDALLSLEREGRIHTTLLQTGTVTGRISSLEPNLQNIPVRTEFGRSIRKALVAGPDMVLLDADYSQIDLRMLAHLSGDETLIAAFRNGEDIHARTAALVYGVPLEQVTPAQRGASKAVNFGIVYGISDYGLSQQLDISRREAAEFIERYLSHYPGVRAYLQRCVESAREKGYAETLLGRRRNMPELQSSNYNIRSFGERAAMNTPVQGSSADIIKLAMLRAQQAFADAGLSARLILQVHDELLAEAPFAQAEAAARVLQKAMEEAAALRVPLVAAVKTGHSWYDTK